MGWTGAFRVSWRDSRRELQAGSISDGPEKDEHNVEG